MTRRKTRPDERYWTLRNLAAAPEHPHECAMWELLKGDGADQTAAYALEIYLDDFEREVFQAWHMARATEEQIEQHLRIPVEVTRLYRHVFFDMNLFRDELSVVKWVREYEEDAPRGSSYGAELLRNANMGGVDALLWLFGRGEHVVESDKVMQQVMTDSYYRGRANRGHSVGSKETAAAHGFMKTAFSAAQTLAKKGPIDGVNALLIKLRYRDMTTPVDKEQQKEDILH